jgi:2'-5' RNA ligase
MPFERGVSAVVVPLPAVEPLVAPWRLRLDVSSPQGMPAHVTTLYPFLREPLLTDAVLARLGALCAATPAFDVVFRRTGRFPHVLYLDPEPAERFRRLTLAIAQEWPEAPPFGGIHDDVIPHLTVAVSTTEEVLQEVDAALTAGLPIAARAEEAWLYVFDGERWQPRAPLTFGE